MGSIVEISSSSSSSASLCFVKHAKFELGSFSSSSSSSISEDEYKKKVQQKVNIDVISIPSSASSCSHLSPTKLCFAKHAKFELGSFSSSSSSSISEDEYKKKVEQKVNIDVISIPSSASSCSHLSPTKFDQCMNSSILSPSPFACRSICQESTFVSLMDSKSRYKKDRDFDSKFYFECSDFSSFSENSGHPLLHSDISSRTSDETSLMFRRVNYKTRSIESR